MLGLFRLVTFKPIFYRPIVYNFVRVSKKDMEKQAKQQEKQSLNLSKTIDFEPFQSKFDQYFTKLSEQITKLQVGKLTPDMLDNLKVQSYGEKMPISNLAQIQQKSQGILILTVFEDSVVADIMKALENSDLNLQLKRQEKQIVCQLAQGNTKESRIQAVNNLKKLIEDGRQHFRAIRHDCLENLRPYKKVSSEDTVRKAEKQVQEIFEKKTDQLDTLLKNKEKDLMKN